MTVNEMQSALKPLDNRLFEIRSNSKVDLSVGVDAAKSYIVDCVYEARLDIDLSHEICMQQDQPVCEEEDTPRAHKLCMLVIR